MLCGDSAPTRLRKGKRCVRKMRIGNWEFMKLVFWFVLERTFGWLTTGLMSVHEFFIKRAVKAVLRVKAAKGEDYEKLEADFVKDCSFLFKKK